MLKLEALKPSQNIEIPPIVIYNKRHWNSQAFSFTPRNLEKASHLVSFTTKNVEKQPCTTKTNEKHQTIYKQPGWKDAGFRCTFLRLSDESSEDPGFFEVREGKGKKTKEKRFSRKAGRCIFLQNPSKTFVLYGFGWFESVDVDLLGRKQCWAFGLRAGDLDQYPSQQCKDGGVEAVVRVVLLRIVIVMLFLLRLFYFFWWNEINMTIFEKSNATTHMTMGLWLWNSSKTNTDIYSLLGLLVKLVRSHL